LYARVAAAYHPHVVLVVLGTDDDRTEWEALQRSISARRPSRPERLFKVWGRTRALWRTRRSNDFSASADEVIHLDEQVRRDGGRLLVVFAPWDGSSLWPVVRRTVLPRLERGGVTVIDASDSLRGVELLRVHQSDPHPDERVHALLAARLAHDVSIAGGPADGARALKP
jgi:hypothetical protein